MALVVQSEAYSLASAEVDGLAEILEVPETLDLVLENVGVHEQVLPEEVAVDFVLLASVQVSQSSVAVEKSNIVTTHMSKIVRNKWKQLFLLVVFIFNCCFN